MKEDRASRHPRGLHVLFFTELWERFGFYTLMALLTLYLDEHFHLRQKGQVYGGFVGLVYFMPILGGLIADRVLGYRRTIVLGAALLVAGYGLLAVPYGDPPDVEARVAAAETSFQAERDAWKERAEAAKLRGETVTEKAPEYAGPERVAGRWLFFLALGTLVLGNGLFKPNISVLVGNLYAKGSPLRDAGFNIFYMGINIGAFIAPLAAAWLRSKFGWYAAFGASAAGMATSLAIFVAFRRHVIPTTDPAASEDRKAERPDAAAFERVLALLTVFGIVILFWLSFYQNGFTLTLWARDSTGPFLGYVIPPETFQAVNPLFIVVLTPALVAFWAGLRRRGREPSTPVKMLIGMLATAVAFAIMAGAGLAGGNRGLVSPLWLVAAYAAISVAELCLSPMGLSLVSRVAPERIRGLMMGLWFGATAAGGYLSGAIEPLWKLWSHSTFFAFLVGTSLFAAVLLAIALPFLRRATRVGS